MQLLFYCNVLPMSYTIDQRTVLFYKRIFRSDNVVLRVLSSLKCNAVCAIVSKNNIPVFNTTEHDIKERLWTHFMDKYIYIYIYIYI